MSYFIEFFKLLLDKRTTYAFVTTMYISLISPIDFIRYFHMDNLINNVGWILYPSTIFLTIYLIPDILCKIKGIIIKIKKYFEVTIDELDVLILNLKNLSDSEKLIITEILAFKDRTTIVPKYSKDVSVLLSNKIIKHIQKVDINSVVITLHDEAYFQIINNEDLADLREYFLSKCNTDMMIKNLNID